VKPKSGYYSAEFRQEAVERMRRGENVRALARELGVHFTQMYRWEKKADPEQRGGKDQGRSAAPSAEARLQQELRQAKQLLAEKTLEIDFFKGALQKVGARRQRSRNSGAQTSTTTSEK
jgi:transposase-like protein